MSAWDRTPAGSPASRAMASSRAAVSAVSGPFLPRLMACSKWWSGSTWACARKRERARSGATTGFCLTAGKIAGRELRSVRPHVPLRQRTVRRRRGRQLIRPHVRLAAGLPVDVVADVVEPRHGGIDRDAALSDPPQPIHL